MKKAFTLVELLGIIVILGILSILLFPNILNNIEKNKQQQKQLVIDNGIKAAQIYTTLNENYTGKLTFRDLKNAGLIKDINDPSTNDVIDGCINVYLDNDLIKYKYIQNNYECSEYEIYGLRLTLSNEKYERLYNSRGKSNYENNFFDTADIYKDIIEVTEDGNTFIKIPKFYIKKVVTDTQLEWYVSKGKIDNDYYLPPCFYDYTNNRELDYVLIGKYDASLNGTKLESKTGKTPKVSLTISEARTYATNNNTDGIMGYQLFDISAYDAIQVLFYIEYLSVDSQDVMYGYANANSSPISSGSTNSITSSSGSSGNNDGKFAMMYRGIENLWGNVYQYLDGIYVNSTNGNIYVNTDPTSYGIYSEYKQLNYSRPSGLGIKKMGYDSSYPFAQYPVDLYNTNSGSIYDDMIYPSGDSTISIIAFGGCYANGRNAGLTTFIEYNPSNTDGAIGARIMKKPL